MVTFRRCLLLILVGCLCLSTGCNSLFNQTDSSQPTTADLQGQLAPGLTAKGVSNIDALTNSHSRILQEDSYMVLGNSSERYANGTVRFQSWSRAQRNSNGTRYYYQIHISHHQSSSTNPFFPQREREYYADHDTVYVAEFSQNQMTVDQYNRSNDTVPQTFTNEMYIESVLYAFNHTADVSITELKSPTDPPRYRVQMTHLENFESLNDFLLLDTVVEASFTMVIDGWGVIHNYQLTYSGRIHNQTVSGNHTLRFTKIGQTHVPQPAWRRNSTHNRANSSQ